MRKNLKIPYILLIVIGSIVPCFGKSERIYRESELLEDLDVMEAIYLHYAPNQTTENVTKAAEYFKTVKSQVQKTLKNSYKAAGGLILLIITLE